MTTKQGSRLMRRVLFLEITGFISLAITAMVVYMLFTLKLIETKTLLAPAAGLLLVFVFIVLTIRYARRDLHKIHELHARPFYKFGRIFVYLLGAIMLAYPVYLIFTHEDFFGTIGAIILAELMLVLGIFTLYYNYTLSYLIGKEHLHGHGVRLADLFLVVLFPILLVSGTIYWLFSQEASTTATGKADFEMSSAAIIAEFEKSDSLATKKFVGKNVLFGGVVAEVAGDSAKLLKLNTGVEGFTANCAFDKSQFASVAKINAGDSVVVQCSCSGMTKPEGEMDMLSESSLDLARCAVQKVVPMKNSGTEVEK